MNAAFARANAALLRSKIRMRQPRRGREIFCVECKKAEVEMYAYQYVYARNNALVGAVRDVSGSYTRDVQNGEYGDAYFYLCEYVKKSAVSGKAVQLSANAMHVVLAKAGTQCRNTI